MDDWEEAAKKAEGVLEIDEANKDARRGLQRVRDAVRRQRRLDRARFGGKTVAKGSGAARASGAGGGEAARADPSEPAFRGDGGARDGWGCLRWRRLGDMAWVNLL